MSKKPRLVFFQFRYDESLPEFLLMHKRDHVKCLSEFFDVTVIDRDCDYQKVCDTYEPDVALFESGLNHATCNRLTIANIRACPDVPRAGLHNADAFCNARSGFLSDMDHWGIETFFTITTTAAEHMPQFADQIYVWPNSIDPDTYRDYGASKSIPVLFSGNTSSLYPWRQSILRLVPEHYPSLICPHPGYGPSPALKQFLCGEPYARMINAALVVPACGTVAHEVIRKHFEIPGCRACLVTERTAPLLAAGFVDMENCVFADEADILDKLEYLFTNPEELRRITTNGYELAHSRHTQRNRDQIYQWFRLQRDLRSDQRIVQTSPFGDLRVVDRGSGVRSSHVAGGGLHLRLLREADARLGEGNYAAAEAAYLKCREYVRWMPEPALGVALSRLHRGNASTAHAWLSELLEYTLGVYGAVDPDPIEWAYYALSLLCLGRDDDAARSMSEFPWLRHPELDRMRQLVSRVTGTPAVRVSDSKPRHTIHRLPDVAEGDWLARMEATLRACGQARLAATLAAGRALVPLHTAGGTCDEQQTPANSTAIRNAFAKRFRQQERGTALRRFASRVLHRLESRVGYFLPYHLSAMRHDELFATVRRTAREHQISRVLLIGDIQTGTAEALLAGIADAGRTPAVFCVARRTDRSARFETTFGGRIACRHLESSSSDAAGIELDQALKDIERGAAGAWDAIVVNGSVLEDVREMSQILEQRLHRSRLAVVEGTGYIGVSETADRFLGNKNYVTVAANPALRTGYLIFGRVARTARASRPQGDASPARS